MSESETKPSFLILGGCGFIGANLLLYIHKHDLASKVVVADLKPPPRCFLPDELLQLFKDKVIEFVHSDIAQDAHVDRLFTEEQPSYTYIINLIGETRNNLSDDVIYNRTYRPLTKIADKVTALCNDPNVKEKPYFIEVSTAQVYDCGSKPSTELSKTKPWTVIARAKLEGEAYLQQQFLKGLPGCILRPTTVYGPGDVTGISPRLCCAAVYQKMNETLKFLWTKSLQLNTVHVDDVVRAILFCCYNRSSTNHKTFNLSDEGNTTQGDINAIIEQLFEIKTDFAGTIMSNLARMNMKKVTDDSNEVHLPQWLDLCGEHNIDNTPYSTYISMELLYNNPLHVDGSLITTIKPQASEPIATVNNTKDLKFQYTHPRITAHGVYHALQHAVNMKLFPSIPLKEPK